MEIKDEGICRFCCKTFSGRSMGRHLVACKAKKRKDDEDASKAQKKEGIHHLKISSDKPYWLHIEMKATATLYELDDFLRSIWLECCGHLSAFRIEGIRYSNPSYELWGGTRSTNVQLRKALGVKDTFEYEYDFGSTTYVKGQIYAAREGKLVDRIRILARSNPPVFWCTSCDAEATHICMECGEPYCRPCLAKHECGDEICLPIVNSPRTGVCGYSGEYDFDDWHPPLER